MSELPNIWRTELWHPMIVHFPIVLLLGALVLRLPAHFPGNKHTEFLIKSSRLSLFAGTLLAWISVYTGSLADSIVTRTLCDPTVLESHENAAYLLVYIFSAASLIEITDYIRLDRFQLLKHPVKAWIVTILLVAGSGYVAYTAHLGATLVYQQGAAVYQPTENCVEFE
ncbi:MAG: DUF2231 domain-containing protein [Balneolaceae bacterium]|nr:DUF2231 domain-containing protein [Balneolaceae bacterium]MDR9409502.1 DUF2231 domain-containing protein [Balneolaceae bacterium]